MINWFRETAHFLFMHRNFVILHFQSEFISKIYLFCFRFYNFIESFAVFQTITLRSIQPHNFRTSIILINVASIKSTKCVLWFLKYFSSKAATIFLSSVVRWRFVNEFINWKGSLWNFPLKGFNVEVSYPSTPI